MLSRPWRRAALLVPFSFLLAAPGLCQKVLYTHDGTDAGDLLGYAVAGAGDVNDDGYDDWIVGAIGDDDAGSSSGSAQVYSGHDGTLLHHWNGDDPDDQFGAVVAGAGDVNNDGYDDLIVGAPSDEEWGTQSGSARVFSGFDGSLLYLYVGYNAFDEVGHSVNGAGDVNGDGFDDFVIGAPGDNVAFPAGGSVRVHSGQTGSLLYTFAGQVQMEWLGYSADGAGDVNGDGYDDIVAGGIGSDVNGTISGVVRVYSGADGTLLYTFPGAVAFEQFGHSVSGAGDVNGDGYGDVIAGSRMADIPFGSAGTVRVYSGQDGSVLHSINGTQLRDYFGSSVDSTGDMNGDGYDDFIVGAPTKSTPGSYTGPGSARVYSGLTGALMFEVQGDDFGDYLGHSVGGAGDVDADGQPDVIVGALGDDNNGDESGSATLLALTPTWWVDASAPGGGDGSQGSPFQTIQAGVNAAGDGERVAVLAGTYVENVQVLSGDILIEAVEPGAIIDGGDLAMCVYFATSDYGQGSYQGLDGFTLRNGNSETWAIGGGGVNISYCSPTIKDCVIEDCHGDFGGGIYAGGGSPILRHVTIRNCYARASYAFSRGGGLMFSICPDALIEGCTIEDNRCDNNTADGGGLYFQFCDDLSILDTTIQRNSAGDEGGGIFTKDSTVSVESCEIRENSATLGGGVLEVSIVDSFLVGNVASLLAGGAYSSDLSGCTLSGNSAGERGGGAFGGSLVDCDVHDNTVGPPQPGADSQGGGVWGATLDSCRLFSNVAIGGPQTISRGGGAYFNVAPNTVERCVIYENTADEGAGTYGGALFHCVVYANAGYGVADGASVLNSIIRANSHGSLANTSNIAYSNVEGIAIGGGNIDAPAKFWAPDGGGLGAYDFHLIGSSPCIDAGDPASPLDPDGSIADMGVHPFEPGHLPEPEVYCTSYADSQGCVARIQTTGGSASLSGSDTLGILATGVQGHQFGLMFWGLSSANKPHLGEILCVSTSLTRSGVSNSNGIGHCGGYLVQEFSSTQIVGAGLEVGDSVYAQFWYRDPSDLVYGSAFSDAVWFVIAP